MSFFYCVIDKSLRERIEDTGIAPADGEGFYLLTDAPEFDADVFDLWSVEADVAPSDAPLMLRKAISPLAVNRLEPRRMYASAF